MQKADWRETLSMRDTELEPERKETSELRRRTPYWVFRIRRFYYMRPLLYFADN